mgnify:FL=1
MINRVYGIFEVAVNDEREDFLIKIKKVNNCQRNFLGIKVSIDL